LLATQELASLQWDKVQKWATELQVLQNIPTGIITPEQSSFRDFLSNKLRQVTAGQLFQSNILGRSGFTNSTAQFVNNVAPEQNNNRTWSQIIDPTGVFTSAYTNLTSTSPPQSWIDAAQSNLQWLKSK
jgi:hypothetical protein